VRKFFKISLFGFSAVIFTLGVVVAIYFWTSLPEKQINQWVGYYLSANTGYRIKIGKINRDLWRRIEVDSLSVTFESDKQVIQIADLAHIETEYSLEGLISRRINLSDLRLSGLNLNIPVDSSGRLAIPRKEGQRNEPTAVDLPEISIESFRIDNAILNLDNPKNPKLINIPGLNGSLKANKDGISLIIDSLQVTYPEKNFRIDSCAATLDYNRGNLKITRLDVKTARSKLSIVGAINKINSPELHLSYKFAPLDFIDLVTLTGVKLDGKADIEGSLEGNIREFRGEASGNVTLFNRPIRDFKTKYHFRDLQIDLSNFSGLVFESPAVGDGYLDFKQNPPRYGYRGTVSELNLQKIGVDLYSLFTGEVNLTGQGLSENNMKMAIDMHLYKADIDIYHFHEAIGKIEFDLKKLTFAPDFKARYKDTWVTFGGDLEYTGQIGLEGDADLANLANFQNQFFIADLDGRGRARFAVSGPTLDFTVAGSFQSDSCRFYGITSRDLNFDLNLHSFISHQTGVVSGILKLGDLYSIPVDTAYFTVSVAGDKYFLDRIFWRNKNNIMEFKGLVDNTVLPPAFIVDTMTTILWNDTVYSARPMLMDVDTNQVEFKDFVLAYKAGRADMLGTITYENEMNLRLNANGFEISPIIKYFNFTRKLSGVLSGRMAVTGNFDSPIFAADYSIDSFAIDKVVQGNFQMEAAYQNRWLDVPSAEIAGDGLLFELSGKFPMELSFTYIGNRFPDQPFTTHITASGTDLPIVPVFVPSVDYVHGNYSAAISLSGTYTRPLATGTFSFADGSVKAIELVDPISGINIAGRMENDLIYVDKITALITQSQKGLGSRFDGYPLRLRSSGGVPGKINGSGTIKLLGIGLFDYSLDLSGKDCEFYTESYDIHGLADLDLHVTGSAPPIITGEISLTRLDMKEPFGTFYTGITDKTEVLEDPTIWDMEIDITALNNLWVKNTDADMEMMGNVQVLRKKGIRNLLGQLEIIRGNFYLFNYKFKIQSGEMTFNDISILDPLINFDVSTRIRETSRSSLLSQNTYGYEDLDLLIDGKLSEPAVHSANDSLHSDEDVLRLLVADRLYINSTPGKNSSLSDKIIANMQALLYTQLKRIPGVDEIDINPYADSLGQTQVSVAKYLSPKLFLRYSRRGFSQTSGETIGIEYMLNNNLSFEGRQGTKNEGISFGLNYKYEF
jgi:autotransporter translocation and assembly factor TamB